MANFSAPAVARTVLVNYSVIHAPRELNPLVRELKLTGWKPTVLIGWTGLSADQVVTQLESEHVPFVRPKSSHSYPSSADLQPEQSIAKRGRGAIGRIAPKWMKLLVHTFEYFMYAKAARRYAREILDAVQPELFLTHNFHSCGRLDNALLAECKRRRIPAACVLVSPLVGKFIARPGRLVLYHAGMTGDSILVSHYGRAGELFARLRKEWVVADERVSIFAWPLSMLLGSMIAGLLPKDVWHSPHEDFDIVFVPNAFSLEILRKSGYPLDRLRMLGAPRLDETLALLSDGAFEKELYRQARIPQGTPYVLWNMEPSWEHSYCTEEMHWAWVRGIADALKATGAAIVISLHPLCDPARYQFLVAEFGFSIPNDLGIHQLYPWASLVVTFPCSTNHYATLFGKRVIMYDWFGVIKVPRRRELYYLEGMRHAETTEELQAIVAQEVAVMGPPDLATLRQLSQSPASRAIVNALEMLIKQLRE